MSFLAKLLAVAGLVVVGGVLGHSWLGLIAAGLAGYWIATGSRPSTPTATRRTDESPTADAVIAVSSLGSKSMEVARLLRRSAGLTIEEAEGLLLAPPEELRARPAHFQFADEVDAGDCLRALTRLGADVELVRS
jgi:hypothetical protein